MCSESMIGKTIEIAGMLIEVLGEDGDSWECRNLTTQQPLLLSKAEIEKAIKLGKAEIVPRESGHKAE